MVPENSIILYVEDDYDDQIIFRECLGLVRPDIICEFANDGITALLKLTSSTLKPACIFIDVNMPVMDGNELLAKIKANPALADIPCFMLSTSKNKRHIDHAEASGAVKYLVKPAVYIDFKNLLAETLQSVEL
jgi:CheY-like chemotaxis protein